MVLVQEGTPLRALPEEIWRMIASYMDVKQWAKTSGLCKTTWKLQLDSIELSPYDVTEMPGEQHIVMSYFYAQSIYKSAQYAGQGIADTAAAVHM